MRPKIKVMRNEPVGTVQQLIKETDGNPRRKLQVIDLAFTGKFTTDEIAGKIGCSRASVTNWLRQYEDVGACGLLRPRRCKPSHLPLLDKDVLDNLFHHLAFALIPCSVGGMQRWLKDHYGIDLSLSAATYWWDELWECLERWDITYPKKLPEVVLPYYGDDADW